MNFNTKAFTLFLLFPFLSFADGILRGKIQDKNKNSIAHATLYLKGTVRSVMSDETGNYIFKSIPEGKYNLEVISLGYITSQKEIQIENQKNTEIDFILEEITTDLQQVTISSSIGVRGNEFLPEVENYTIYATKKNEIIPLKNVDANLAMNNNRQIFGRTPGLMIWESESSGIQTSIAVRGLSPNRSWEFNVRLNGYDITPDPMGYPEAYYTPPAEVVDRIEIVRGASSLQYGSQVGGLLNYVLRKPDASKRFVFESQNTVGSQNLFSTFNYVGGTEGRWNYTLYYQKRTGDGWRQNNTFSTDHAHIEVGYSISNKLKIGAEVTYMTYVSQQPGGLTDIQFNQNPQASVRSRNWFSTPWLMPTLTLDYVFSTKTKLNFKIFGTVAERNSLGILTNPDQTDLPNAQNIWTNRIIDRDFYKNIGSELRLLSDYTFLKKKNRIATGLRFFRGTTERLKNGKGDSEIGYNLNLVEDYTQKLYFENKNYAAFLENIFYVNTKFLFTLGIRLEKIQSYAHGKISATGQISPQETTRNFSLWGLGAEYHLSTKTQFYSNLSQGFRPVLFSDITPASTTDVIDSNLKDAKSLNFDFGYRGKVKNFLRFDVNYFWLLYENRIGSITQLNANQQAYLFRTNLGSSISQGMEGYVEVDLLAFLGKGHLGSLSWFQSFSFMEADYQDFRLNSIANGIVVESNLKGKKVEYAPTYTYRTGINYRFKKLSVSWQLSSISSVYADAQNTESPSANGRTGKIPSYQVQDLSASFQFKKINIRSGINNLFNEKYFTRRSGGYPGPGVLPADGQTFFCTIGIKLF